MAQFLTDTCTDTDTTTLASHTSDSGGTWVSVSGYSGQTAVTAQITTNTIRSTSNATSATAAFYRSTQTPGNADYTVTGDFTINTVPADFNGICARHAGTTIGGYAVLFNASIAQLWNLASLGTVAASVAFVPVAGVTYRITISAIGTAIDGTIQRLSDNFYLNSSGTFVSGATTFSSATNSAITAAGVPAFLIRGNLTTSGTALDNITANDTTGGAHTTSGSLTGQIGSIVGTSTRSGGPTTHTTNGSLTGQIGTVSGIAVHTGVGPVTIPVTDTNVFFSPYTWISDGAGVLQSNNIKAGSTYAVTPLRGAYLKTKFTVGASGTITLNLDCSMLTNVTVGGTPTITWSINHAAIQSQLLATATTTVAMATGLAAGTYDVELWFRSVFITQDGGSTANYTNLWNVVKITSFTLSVGGFSSAPTIKPKNLLVFGDSITEGDINMSGTRSASSQDATQVWGAYLSEALNAEVGIVGYRGQNWSFFNSTWSSYAAGFSRLFGGLLSPAPDYVIENYGHNDGSPGPSTASVNSTINAIKTAAPSAKIILSIPFTGVARTNISAATLPVNGALIDIALPQQVNGSLEWSFDGIHPDARGHSHIAVNMANAINSATFTATSRTITLTLVNTANSPQASLTNLKWAFWDNITPDLLVAPVSKGAIESTDGAGQIVINVNTTLSSGGVGWLVVTNSDGIPATVHKAFSGPVTVV